ncbi:MAG: DUF4876 domain-containing protein [Leadbetterella sp.]|nr:DUF4876 domain-containing protein [Leadbetterella sp.]
MKQVSAFLFFVMAFVVACSDDPDELLTSEVSIKVAFPDNYSTGPASGVTVTLTGVADGAVKTAVTAETGTALFSKILPGTYSVNVTKTLSEQEALTLTGIAESITLNAIENSLVVISGQDPVVELKLQGSAVGNLLIKEVYYTGSPTPGGGTYFSDQFIEIYNNSTETLYLDQLMIADAYGVAGLINPTNVPTPFNEDKDYTYVNTVWRIPGSGKEHPLEPGKSIIIAQDGVNHKNEDLNPASPVDLSKADWETYNERPDNRDADAPDVPNLEKLYYNGGFDWNLPVFGPGLIIFKADFEALEQVAIPGASAATAPRIKVPNTVVIDAFEGLKDANSGSFKRIPVALDAGFVYADDTYNQQSFRRKTAKNINGRRVLQDTNNSTGDFEKLSKPTPKIF